MAQPRHPFLNTPDLFLHSLTWAAGLPLVSTTTTKWFSAILPGHCPSAACWFVFFFLVVQPCVWLRKNAFCLNESSTPIDPDGIVLVTCPL